MTKELMDKISLFPDLDIILQGGSVTQYFKHISEMVSYYDKAISDCMHCREFKRLSFAQITKLHKLEKELQLQRRRYKRINGFIQNEVARVKIASMLDGFKYIHANIKDDNVWQAKTNALSGIIIKEDM